MIYLIHLFDHALRKKKHLKLKFKVSLSLSLSLSLNQQSALIIEAIIAAGKSVIARRDTRLSRTCSNKFHVSRNITDTLLPSFTRLTARAALLNDPCNGWLSRTKMFNRGYVREILFCFFSFYILYILYLIYIYIYIYLFIATSEFTL